MRAIVGYFFSDVFQSPIFEGWFIPSQLHLFINGIIFETLSGFHLISASLNATVAAYWKYLSTSFFGFIVSFFLFYPVYIITYMNHHV